VKLSQFSLVDTLSDGYVAVRRQETTGWLGFSALRAQVNPAIVNTSAAARKVGCYWILSVMSGDTQELISS
jgi:hypothetical protein